MHLKACMYLLCACMQNIFQALAEFILSNGRIYYEMAEYISSDGTMFRVMAKYISSNGRIYFV